MAETVANICGVFIALFVWWLLYGLECYLNGATSRSHLLMPFRCLIMDLSYNLPGGKQRMLNYYLRSGWELREARNAVADIYPRWPGWLHICIMHIALPLVIFIGVRGLILGIVDLWSRFNG